MYGGDRVLVPTPALIALAVRGHSVLSYFGWTIVSRLDYMRYIEKVLNIQGFSRRQSRQGRPFT